MLKTLYIKVSSLKSFLDNEPNSEVALKSILSRYNNEEDDYREYINSINSSMLSGFRLALDVCLSIISSYIYSGCSYSSYRWCICDLKNLDINPNGIPKRSARKVRKYCDYYLLDVQVINNDLLVGFMLCVEILFSIIEKVHS